MNPSDITAMIRRALFLSGKSEKEIVASISSFRDFAVQILKLSTPDTAVILIGSSSLRMTDSASQAVRTVSLSRPFSRLDPNAPSDSLHVFVTNLSSLVRVDPDAPPQQIEELLGDVVPLLKSSNYAVGNASLLRRQHAQSGHDPDLHAKVQWEVNSHVVAYPVFNEPHGYRFITGDQLLEGDLTASDIQEIAIQNLRDIANSLPRSDYSEGLKEYSGLNGVASALVLLPEFLEAESEQAGGPLCLLSGDADHLFIVPLANEDFLNYLLGRVAKGSLQLPEIPPLVYQEGCLEPAGIQEVSAASPPLR
ncbi:hypothetical protein G6L37_01530 [Agrobacterium rubi]|nr:hypothetical protein [Agrobacterium rubi]NTF24074.1 hypothetical protein [Agrobacterium rubi]